MLDGIIVNGKTVPFGIYVTSVLVRCKQTLIRVFLLTANHLPILKFMFLKLTAVKPVGEACGLGRIRIQFTSL